jgi:capsular exopolysaccharide synthesis family protein
MQNAVHPYHGPEGRNGMLQRIEHYRGLIWRARWYCLGAGAVFTVLAVVATFFLAGRVRDQQSTVFIGVENTTDISAVKDVSGLMQAQSDLILSRTFLSEIVKRLSLQLSMRKVPRSAVFDTVSVDSLAPAGLYTFRMIPHVLDSFEVLFTRDAESGNSLAFLSPFKKRTAVYRGKISELTVLQGDGMRLVFSRRFISAPSGFAFRISDVQHAVEDLHGRITVKESDARDGVSNISVSVKGKDYRLIADAANRIADAFVEKNMSFKKARTNGVVASLEKQLEMVSRDLSASSDMLRDFRAANPTVGLSENVKQRIGGLSQMEKSVSDSKENIAGAHDLLTRYEAAPPEDRSRIVGEALAFLAKRNVSSATAFQADMADLTAQARDLERSYSVDHPLRVDVANKIDKLGSDVIASLKDYAASLDKTVASRTSDIQAMSSDLQSLPSKELQLAELERRHQIFSDIYSTVMSRYNQAKVLNAGEVAEAFVMDRAVPPVPEPVSKPKLLALAIIFALALTLLPLLAYDFFDGTAHSETEFLQKAGKAVIEGIPTIVSFKNTTHNGRVHAVHPAPLVAAADKEGVSREVFRVLRTKIMLRLDESREKSLVVTSLEPGAGKSTVSANLARSIARQHTKTLIIDGDLRRGTLHTWFGKRQSPGLSEYLSDPGTTKLEDIIQPTDLPELFCISSGRAEQASTELFASGGFQVLKQELAKRFSFILMDSPPLDAVTDAAIIASLFSGFLIVARAGSTNVHDLTQTVSEYPEIDGKVLGYVLNRVASDKSHRYYRYRSYYSVAPSKAVSG